VSWYVDTVHITAHFQLTVLQVGLATVGPQFDPNNTYWDSFQQLSLILMASRITLLFQYGLSTRPPLHFTRSLYLTYTIAMAFTWKYARTRLPLALVMLSLAIAAILYLGLSFAFSTESNINAYIAWYVVAVFEVGSNIAIAGKWHILSFKETHLVERMTCLTLIVVSLSEARFTMPNS
jgi:hypothetical protein